MLTQSTQNAPLFFNRVDGFVERDEEGTELANLDIAAVQAVVFAGASLQEAPQKIWNGQDFRVEVTDHTGLVLFTVITIGVRSPATEHA